MQYYRRWVDIQHHPKPVAAGFWGTAVFTALCDINAEFDLGGEIPAHYANPQFVLRAMNLWDADCPAGGSMQTVCNGMQRARVAGLIVQHEDGSVTLPGWADRNPNVPSTSTERSQKRRRLLKESRDATQATLPMLPPVAATLGEERRGEEKKRNVLLLPERTDSISGAEAVFQHWKRVMQKNDRTAFDEKRRRAVERALSKLGYTASDLCAAIEGCAASPFHHGRVNGGGILYDDLELICRDAKHIEQFIEFKQHPPKSEVRGRVGAEAHSTMHEVVEGEQINLGRKKP